MNRLVLIAAAALVIAALGAGFILSSGRGPGPALPTPTALPSPSTLEVVAPFPEELWGDWLTEAERIPGLSAVAQRLQLAINWEGGRTAWIQLNGEDGRFVAQSSSMAALDGEIRFRADPGAFGCTFGQDGRYRWSRSSDGLFLTLELIEDACQARGIALARTWVRSHGAVNDGGPGVLYGMDPDMQFTMPTGQRYGLGGADHTAELKTFGDALPFRAFVAIRNPGGFADPCSTTDTQKMNLDRTTAAFVTYVEGLPGATVTTAGTTIGGRPAVRLDVTIDAEVDCASGEIDAFHPQNLDEDLAYPFLAGEVQPLYIVQMDADNTLLIWYQGGAGEEAAVLGSLTFIDELPRP